jgi:hypothetical protein
VVVVVSVVVSVTVSVVSVVVVVLGGWVTIVCTVVGCTRLVAVVV